MATARPTAVLGERDLAWAPFVGAVAATAGALMALSAYVATPFALPALFVAAAFVAITYRRPELGVAGALVVLAADRLKIPVPGGGIAPAEGAFLVVAGCALLHAVRGTGTPLPRPSARDAGVLLLITAFLGGLLGLGDPLVAVRLAVLWAAFWVVALQVSQFDRRQVLTTVRALGLGGGVFAAFALVTILGGGGEPQLYAGGLETGSRDIGAFGDANYMTALLSLAALPALALGFADPRKEWLQLGAFGLMVLAIALSLSRGGLVALAAGFLVLLALWGRFRIAAVVLVGILAGLTLFNANPLTQTQQFQTVETRLGTLTSGNLGATNTRPRLWRAAWETFEERPLLGIGPNAFEIAATRKGVYEDGGALENVHNLPLNTLAELGLVGFAGLVLLLGGTLQDAYRAARRRAADVRSRAVGLGLLAGLVGFCAQSLTIVPIRVVVIAGVLLVVAGLCRALAAPADARAA